MNTLVRGKIPGRAVGVEIDGLHILMGILDTPQNGQKAVDVDRIAVSHFALGQNSL